MKKEEQRKEEHVWPKMIGLKCCSFTVLWKRAKKGWGCVISATGLEKNWSDSGPNRKGGTTDVCGERRKEQ